MKKSKWFILLLGIVCSLFFSAKSVSAEIIKLDPNKNNFQTEGELLIQRNPSITSFTSTITAGSGTNVTYNLADVSKDAPVTPNLNGSFFDSDNQYNAWNSHYFGMLPGYADKTLRINGTPSDLSKFTVTNVHGNAGVYINPDGTKTAVDVKFTYSGFKYVKHMTMSNGTDGLKADPTLPSGWGSIAMQMSSNPSNGISLWNASQYDVAVEFFDHTTGQKLDVTSNMLTFNSLNYRALPAGTLPVGEDASEGVTNLDRDVSLPNSTTKVYLDNNTNIGTGTIYQADGTYFKGTSEDFTDYVGGATFSRNSVYFDLSGDVNKFRVATGWSEIWTTYSTAKPSTSDPTPEGFTKRVKNLEGENINKEQVQVGDEIYYEFKSGVAELQSQINQKYTKYEISDELPKEVEFVRGEFYTADGKEISGEAGTFTYDKTTNKIVFKVNDNFLQNGFKYELGETYYTRLYVKVKEGVKDNTIFTNQATLTINVVDFPSNIVENKTPDPNIITKSIVTSDKNEVDLLELPEGQKEIPFKFSIKVTNASKLAALQFSDLLETPFTFKSIKFTLDGKDVTSDWVRDETVSDPQLILFDAKEDVVKNYIDKTFTVSMTVELKSDYDMSKYADNQIPNTARLITNFDSATSNEVNVVPYPDTLFITKTVVNELGEEVTDTTLTDNTKAVEFKGNFLVPNKPSKTYKVTGVQLREPLDAAFEFKNKAGDFVVTDVVTGKDVTDQAVLTTEDNGQTPVLTFKDSFVNSMKGKLYSIYVRAYYREGTDLSKYENGKIPNHYNVKVTTDDNNNPATIDKESNEVTVKPAVDLESPTKGILNDEGQIVSSYKLLEANQTITFTGQFPIRNDQNLTEISYADTLDKAFELVEFRLYTDATKQTVIYNSTTDKEVTTKGTFSYDTMSNVVKYTHKAEGLQDFAGKTTYAEMDVKVKADADLSGYKDRVIPNPTWTLILNGKETPSNPVDVEVPANTPERIKKWEVDGKFVDHLDSAKQGQALPMYLGFLLPNTTTLTDYLIQDTLVEGLTTTTDELNKAKITYDGKDVTDKVSLTFNKDTRTIALAINKKDIGFFTGGKRLEVRLNLFLDATVDTSKDQNFTNVAYEYINGDKDGNPTNEITVDTEKETADKVEKWQVDTTNNNALLDKTVITDLTKTIRYRVKATIVSKFKDKVVFGDVLPEQFDYVGNEDVFILSKDNEKTDIKDKGTFKVEGQNVFMTLTAAQYAALNSQELYMELDVKPNDKAKIGDTFDNVGKLTVDDKETTVKVPVTIPENVLLTEKWRLDPDNDNSLDSSLTITDLNKVQWFRVKSTATGVVTKEIVIKDTLPEFMSFGENRSVFYLDKDNKKVDVSDKGTFKVEGQVLTFTMTAENANNIPSDSVFMDYDSKPNDKATKGMTGDNIAVTIKDGKESPEAKVPVTIPAETPTDTPTISTPNQSTTSGGKLPQTGEIVSFVSLVGVLLVANVLLYKKRQAAKDQLTDDSTHTDN